MSNETFPCPNCNGPMWACNAIYVKSAPMAKLDKKGIRSKDVKIIGVKRAGVMDYVCDKCGTFEQANQSVAAGERWAGSMTQAHYDQWQALEQNTANTSAYGMGELSCLRGETLQTVFAVAQLQKAFERGFANMQSVKGQA